MEAVFGVVVLILALYGGVRVVGHIFGFLKTVDWAGFFKRLGSGLAMGILSGFISYILTGGADTDIAAFGGTIAGLIFGNRDNA